MQMISIGGLTNEILRHTSEIYLTAHVSQYMLSTVIYFSYQFTAELARYPTLQLQDFNFYYIWFGFNLTKWPQSAVHSHLKYCLDRSETMKKRYHTLWEQWVTSSLALNKVDPLQFLIPITQGLGKIDVELREWEAENLKEQSIQQSRLSESKIIEFNDKVIQSHLWVLGVYEVIRTLSQKAKTISNIW